MNTHVQIAWLREHLTAAHLQKIQDKKFTSSKINELYLELQKDHNAAYNLLLQKGVIDSSEQLKYWQVSKMREEYKLLLKVGFRLSVKFSLLAGIIAFSLAMIASLWVDNTIEYIFYSVAGMITLYVFLQCLYFSRSQSREKLDSIRRPLPASTQPIS